MRHLFALVPRSLAKGVFWFLYWCFFVLSLFAIIAPRPVLERTGVYVWSWALLIPPAYWLACFIRRLYRGGE